MKGKAVIFILLAIIAASSAYLLLRGRGKDFTVVHITRDGVLLEEIDLEKVDTPYSFVLEDESGTNTVQVERSRICISRADCPDQVCVNQGWISDGTVPIICLPHKLIIEIVNGGGDLDGAAG